MAYIGQTPTAIPLVAGDITDGIISEAKLAADAVSLAKMKAATDGNLITFDASGNPAYVATGSDGQVLTSTGAGSAPAFEALPAGGAWEFVSIATASTDASLAFTNMASGYDYNYSIGRLVSSDNGTALQAQVGVAGPTYRTSGYLTTMSEIQNDGASLSGEVTAGLDILGSGVGHMGSTGNESVVAEYLLYDPANGSSFTMSRVNTTAYNSAGEVRLTQSGGIYNTGAEAHTSIKFFPGGGTLTGDIVQTRRKRSA